MLCEGSFLRSVYVCRRALTGVSSIGLDRDRMICRPLPSRCPSGFAGLLTSGGRRVVDALLKAERIVGGNSAVGPQRGRDWCVRRPSLHLRADVSRGAGKGKIWTSKS